MYWVTFKMSMADFWKQLLSPLILTFILAVASVGLVKLVPDINLFVDLSIKGIVYLIISISYIQLTKEYDIISKLKTLKQKQ